MKVSFAARSAFSAAAIAILALALDGIFSQTARASDCAPEKPEYFTVSLPKLGAVPAAENPQGWDFPPVWGDAPAGNDSITVPNGRPIYALIISGYAINGHFDELLMYNFARHLMSKGAYVHWAWWNNLLKPYLGGPLHYAQSDPGTAADLTQFTTPELAANKAVPADDYQFIADAKLFLSAIRANNPEAIIIIVGHSMGGAACARLADQTDVIIDLAAPIDPVGNRNYPWAGPSFSGDYFYNWTRWRATRAFFHGFKYQKYFPLQGGCTPQDPWFETYAKAQTATSPFCSVYVDPNGPMSFGSNIINLYHAWQNEAAFPFDFNATETFIANPPDGGSAIQGLIGTQSVGSDPKGLPNPNLGGDCCPIGFGVAWPADGHGEIIGTCGPVSNVIPLGTRVRTSPLCNGCPDTDWPARTLVLGTWHDDNKADRILKMQHLETYAFCNDPPNCTNNPAPSPDDDPWPYRPYNAALCKISPLLINRFNTMNKPAIADAGPDQFLNCSACTSALVTLNAAGSSDPENKPLQYKWSWNGGSVNGPVANVTLPYGPTCVALQVTDSVGHISLDYTRITISDPSVPVLPFAAAASIWKKDASDFEAYAFDSLYHGLPNDTGCLKPQPTQPAFIELKGGLVTVSAFTGATPYCVITDSGTAPAVSDALINDNNSFVRFDFEPSVTAFYTYFGSLAAGKTGTLKLYTNSGTSLVANITTPPSTDSSLAHGFGFTSAIPIDRVEITSNETGPVLIGAFVGLDSSEPSLGTVTIPNYQGPDGTTVQLDFAVAFADPCPADLNDTGAVNISDLTEVILAWGTSGPTGDVNGDSVVNIQDLTAVILAWGACP